MEQPEVGDGAISEAGASDEGHVTMTTEFEVIQHEINVYNASPMSLDEAVAEVEDEDDANEVDADETDANADDNAGVAEGGEQELKI